MLQPLSVPVQQSISELRGLQKRHPQKYKALQMLVLLKQQGNLSKDKLSLLLGSSDKSISIWRNQYLAGGIGELLIDKRGGKKPGKITTTVHKKLAERLANPKQGFRSFIEIQQWLEKEFAVAMQYHAVNKYVKRKFGARLKVSRKSHVQKSATDEVVFKKSIRKV
jgi:transposase